MKSTELYKVLSESVESGEDLAIHIHHGQYVGQIQNISERADRIILSNEFNPRESRPDNLIEALLDLLSDWLDEDLEVVVRVPSMGFFRIIGAKREHYEWEDDAPYDTIDILCEDEPFCGGQLDDLRHYVRNHNIAEQYEDYDEGKKVDKNQLFESLLADEV